MITTNQTTTERTDMTRGAPRLELYETAMCCETGVCGPSVDEQLLSIRTDLRWAETQGATVVRHNLTSDPGAFVANPKVTGLMQAFGEKALPVLVVDGQISLYGRYPTREDLASVLDAVADAPAQPVVEATSSGCCAPGTSC